MTGGSAAEWDNQPMLLPTLEGQTVRLRPIVESDRARVVAIRQTDAVKARWRGDDLDAEFSADLADDDIHQFVICDRSGETVGLIQFSEENDLDYRHASIDLFVDPEVHRLGIATDALETLIGYLFDVRGHHRLVIDPAADNVAAIECYSRVGFKPVGIMRQYERQTDDTWSDGLLMEMLASDRGPQG